MRKTIYISLAIALVLLFSSWVNAQRPGHGFGKRMGRMDKHAKNLENLRMLKLLELLELSDEQNDKFIASFASFRNKGKDLNEEFQKEIDVLAEMLHDSISTEDKISGQIGKIYDFKRKRDALMEDFHKDVKNILTVVQMGKMIIFEERFERELLESVRGLRGKGFSNPGDAPGHPMTGSDSDEQP